MRNAALALSLAGLSVLVVCMRLHPTSEACPVRAPRPGEIPPVEERSSYYWRKLDTAGATLFFSDTTAGALYIAAVPRVGNPYVVDVPTDPRYWTRWERPFPAQGEGGRIVAFVEGKSRVGMPPRHFLRPVRSRDDGRTFNLGTPIESPATFSADGGPGKGDHLEASFYEPDSRTEYTTGSFQALRAIFGMPLGNPIEITRGRYLFESDDLGMHWTGPEIDANAPQPEWLSQEK